MTSENIIIPTNLPELPPPEKPKKGFSLGTGISMLIFLLITLPLGVHLVSQRSQLGELRKQAAIKKPPLAGPYPDAKTGNILVNTGVSTGAKTSNIPDNTGVSTTQSQPGQCEFGGPSGRYRECCAPGLSRLVQRSCNEQGAFEWDDVGGGCNYSETGGACGAPDPSKEPCEWGSVWTENGCAKPGVCVPKCMGKSCGENDGCSGVCIDKCSEDIAQTIVNRGPKTKGVINKGTDDTVCDDNGICTSSTDVILKKCSCTNLQNNMGDTVMCNQNCKEVSGTQDCIALANAQCQIVQLDAYQGGALVDVVLCGPTKSCSPTTTNPPPGNGPSGNGQCKQDSYVGCQSGSDCCSGVCTDNGTGSKTCRGAPRGGGGGTDGGGSTGGGEGTPTPTLPPAPQCSRLKVYKNSQVVTDYSTLRAGDQLNLAVSGAGAIKGRIRVNGGNWNETTTKNTAGEYVVSFTVPANTTSFSIEGAVFANNQWI